LIQLGLVWTFVACSIICTDHALEVQSEQVARSAVQTALSEEAACCPISSSQLSILPDRRTPIPQVSGDQAALCGPSAELPPSSPSARTRQVFPLSIADLPLGRSRVLRI